MTTKPLALLNARLLDPATGTETRGGLLIRDGVIADLGAGVTRDAVDSETDLLDCRGNIVAPGLIDMRVFVGEPGAEHRETIATASAAAVAGGVTTLVAVPDTHPPIDSPAVVDFLLRRAREHSQVRILPSAAITKGLAGLEIAEIGLLKEAGAVAFTDGYHSIRNTQVMRRAMTYARDFDALIIHYAEDADLAGSGGMNAGELASRLGLGGVPPEAETIVLDRDMRLVNMIRGRYHAAFASSRLSLEVIERAKQAGLPVTCGISINHLTLNERDVGEYRTFFKFAPPLRGEEERKALVAALGSGLIDVLVSDHNPQDVETKRLPFGEAENGAVGLETMLAAGLRLVHAGDLSLAALLRAMTVRPAEILGLPQGRLAKGAPADLICFDPDEPFLLDPTRLHSRSKNTPFERARLQGRVQTTIVNGKVI
jgi:dihydroorotase